MFQFSVVEGMFMEFCYKANRQFPFLYAYAKFTGVGTRNEGMSSSCGHNGNRFRCYWCDCCDWVGPYSNVEGVYYYS